VGIEQNPGFKARSLSYTAKNCILVKALDLWENGLKLAQNSVKTKSDPFCAND